MTMFQSIWATFLAVLILIMMSRHGRLHELNTIRFDGRPWSFRGMVRQIKKELNEED
jgi:hypothetical protein